MFREPEGAMSRLSAGPGSAYLAEPCPGCLAEPSFDREMSSCPRCGYAFPLVFVLPYDCEWDYSPDLFVRFQAHDGFRLLGKFTGNNPERLASLSHARYLYLSRYPRFTFEWLRGFGRLLSLELDYAGLASLEGIAELPHLVCMVRSEGSRRTSVSAEAEAGRATYGGRHGVASRN